LIDKTDLLINLHWLCYYWLF